MCGQRVRLLLMVSVPAEFVPCPGAKCRRLLQDEPQNRRYPRPRGVHRARYRRGRFPGEFGSNVDDQLAFAHERPSGMIVRAAKDQTPARALSSAPWRR